MLTYSEVLLFLFYKEFFLVSAKLFFYGLWRKVESFVLFPFLFFYKSFGIKGQFPLKMSNVVYCQM